MKLISITHTPKTGRVLYDFTFGKNEIKTYSADLYDDAGIRGVTCAPDLEELLLKAQAKNSNAAKTLIKATWDFIDGENVIFPIDL